MNKLKRHFKKKYLTPLLILLLLGAFLSLGLGKPSPLTPANTTLSALAQELITKCQSRGDDGVQGCYNEELPRLMDRGISMEQAFQVIRLIQAKDDRFWYCHVASHSLVAKEIDRDPSKWKDLVMRCPYDICSNGCIHGAFQERFKLDALTDQQIEQIFPDLSQVCEKNSNWDPTTHDQTSCYHGLGHTVMYLTGAMVGRSADLCRRLGEKDDGRTYVQTCTEGIFMQLYQPREPEDIALVKSIAPDKKSFKSFCDQWTSGIRDACYREGWILFQAEVQTPQGALSFCDYTTDPQFHFLCLDKIFQTFMVLHGFKDQEMKDFCQALPQENQPLCFTDAAYRLVTADKNLADRSIAICNYAMNNNVGDDCFARLTSTSTILYHQNSADFIDYCSKFPDRWRNKCLVRN